MHGNGQYEPVLYPLDLRSHSMDSYASSLDVDGRDIDFPQYDQQHFQEPYEYQVYEEENQRPYTGYSSASAPDPESPPPPATRAPPPRPSPTVLPRHR